MLTNTGGREALELNQSIFQSCIRWGLIGSLCHQNDGELLPRHSNLTNCFAVYFCSLSLKSPSPAVNRHLSLRCSDFPHATFVARNRTINSNQYYINTFLFVFIAFLIKKNYFFNIFINIAGGRAVTVRPP